MLVRRSLTGGAAECVILGSDFEAPVPDVQQYWLIAGVGCISMATLCFSDFACDCNDFIPNVLSLR